ncbi:MAG: hydrogenase iron-sulfur subunit [Promethearchaeota archaeon]|nr:MAG: hydrogenase iron-sulfur subunit [Candidatus Lokiarchaeota archaeon]
MGINPKRIKMAFCSSAEGAKFRDVATQFDKEIRELGPSILRKKDDTQKNKAKA